MQKEFLSTTLLKVSQITVILIMLYMQSCSMMHSLKFSGMINHSQRLKEGICLDPLPWLALIMIF